MTVKGGGRKQTDRPAAVCWTDRALNDLLAIEDYIAADDPVAAARWVQALADKAKSAALSPLGGRIVPELGRPKVREVFKRSYRIVYRVRPDGIDVLTIFEGHRLFPAGVRGEAAADDNESCV